jgi:cyclophilin family peptidyl-prolyl cis-trans isomerase
VGSATNGGAIASYVTDFDTSVALTAAALATRWSGRAVAAQPRPLAIETPSWAELESLVGARLRVTMEGGEGPGTFEITLDPAEAPLSVARVVRLARRGYFNGLTWHRIAPNFVIQGGSPGANEYAGDGPFMRDELGLRSHVLGTVGISTRGRDTGDAQLFVNLVDNFRLDHDYTIIGRVTSGLDVARHVQEGDRMVRVEVVAGR